MDLLTILIVAVIVVAIAAAVFAVIRTKQRSGSVLASPAASDRDRESP